MRSIGAGVKYSKTCKSFGGSKMVETDWSDDHINRVVRKFREKYPRLSDDWEGDAQEFFEYVGDDGVLDFFCELYGV